MTPPTSWLPLPGWMCGSHSTESLSEPGRKFPNAVRPISGRLSGLPPQGRHFTPPFSQSIINPSLPAANTISPPSALFPESYATPSTPSLKRKGCGSRYHPETKRVEYYRTIATNSAFPVLGNLHGSCFTLSLPVDYCRAQYPNRCGKGL